MKTALEIAAHWLEFCSHIGGGYAVCFNNQDGEILAREVIKLTKEREHASETALHLYDKGIEQTKALKEAQETIQELGFQLDMMVTRPQRPKAEQRAALKMGINWIDKYGKR